MPHRGKKVVQMPRGMGLKNVLFPSFLDLVSIKSKLIQGKFSPRPYIVKIGHSAALASHLCPI